MIRLLIRSNSRTDHFHEIVLIVVVVVVVSSSDSCRDFCEFIQVIDFRNYVATIARETIVTTTAVRGRRPRGRKGEEQQDQEER